MSCLRGNMSFVQDIMSCARHNPQSKEKSCTNYTTVHLLTIFLRKVSADKLA